MSNQSTSEHGIAQHPVVIRPAPSGRVIAEPLGVPELRVEAATFEDAVRDVRQSLGQWNGSLIWVPVSPASFSVPTLLECAGHAKDDPDFDAYVEEIRRAREEADRQECPSTCSTPTT